MDFGNSIEWASFFRRPRSSPDEIRRVQERRLQKVVQYAATRVPYYRELFRSVQLKPEDVRTVADLRHVPVTGKADLQSRPVTEFLADGIDPARMITLSTSGSTGQPTQVLRSQREQYILQAVRLRAQMSNGLRARDLRVAVGSRWRQRHPLDRLGLFQMRHVDGADFPELVTQLRHLRPEVIMARPSILHQIAQEATRTSTTLPPIRLTFVGAELLTPSVRASIEHTWQCQVFNEYASNELPLMSSECRHCSALHTVDDAVVIELLHQNRPVGPGETGRVVGTGLHSFAMPIIRFDFGDIARRPAETPQCPIGFDSIQLVEGREMEFIQLPDGGVLSPYTVQRTIQDVPGVGRFRVQQHSREKVTVLIEHASSASVDLAGNVQRQLQTVFPSSVCLDIQVVDEIQSTTTKFRYIQSSIDHN